MRIASAAVAIASTFFLLLASTAARSAKASAARGSIASDRLRILFDASSLQDEPHPASVEAARMELGDSLIS